MNERICLLALFLAVLSACAAAPKPVPTPSPAVTVQTPEPPSSPATTTAAPANDADSSAPLAAAPIYYELDSATLRPESQQLLVRVAEELRRRPEAVVKISGHTCELGTTEYNLALGQRRATAAREYLARLGVEPTRISTVSYGEEMPAVQGSGEAVWSKNRRSEFSFTIDTLRAERR